MQRLLLIIIFLSMCTNIYEHVLWARDGYTTVFVDGLSPLSIDGSLSDWAFDGPVSTHLIYCYGRGADGAKTAMKSLPEDLSATLSCFADNRYLYIAVTVTDDFPIDGGNKKKGDAVSFTISDIETGVPYCAATVSTNSYGETEAWKEGAVSAQLVQARFHGKFVRDDHGYNVEIAIPTDIFDTERWHETKRVRLNCIVTDYDNNDRQLKTLELASKDEGYRIFAFEALPGEAISPETLLFLAQSNEMAGNYEKSMDYLQKTLNTTRDNKVRLQAQLALARANFGLARYDEAASICKKIQTNEIEPPESLECWRILASIEQKKKHRK